MADIFGLIDYEKFNFTPILTLFNQAAPPAVDIIPAAQLVPLPCDCLIRITISENTGVVFSLALTREETTVVMDLNGGVALTADAMHRFDVNCRAGDTINFRFGGMVPLTINVLNVDMIKTTGP